MTPTKRKRLAQYLILSLATTRGDGEDGPNFTHINSSKFMYLAATDDKGEGYFVILDEANSLGQLDVDTYRQVLIEAKKAKLKPPFHVCARYEVYQSPNVYFHPISKKIFD